MKKLSTLLFFTFLCLIFLPARAKTIRINSSKATVKEQNLFASLQEAHDETTVQSGDTLLVEGSIKTYSNLNCSKKLVIIGPGFFLTQNANTQASPLPALVQQIKLSSGSEGSTLIGLTFGNGSLNNLPYVGVDNITIMRCHLTYGINLSGNINNLLILQNYFERSVINVESINYTFSGIIFKNNIVREQLSITTYDGMPRTFAVVDHNLFLKDVNLTASSFRNNIIANKTAVLQINSSAVQNNLTAGTQLAERPGNQAFTDEDLFVGLSAANQSPDAQYKLKTTSPFLTAGYNGTEPGIFGGSEPYRLSGIPPIPTIYEIQADAVATKDAGLRVTVKAKSNQ